MSQGGYRSHLASVEAGCEYSDTGHIIAGPDDVLQQEFAYIESGEL
jgi:hypothetical protein